jgi:hypothetical protein
MPKWSALLEPKSSMDMKARAILALLLAFYNWQVGTHIETPYPANLVELYSVPLSRLLLLGLVLLSAHWCPSVGIMASLAYICLAVDVTTFTSIPPEMLG